MLEAIGTIIVSIFALFIGYRSIMISKSLLTFEQQRDKTTQRQGHDRMLIGEPLNGLRGSIRYYSDVITNVYVSLRDGEISIPRMNITDRISREEELLHEHLNTGYPQLLQSIETYQDSYNGIRDQVHAIYQKGMDLLVQSWEGKGLITVEHSPARIISIFKDIVSSRLYQQNEPLYARIKQPLIISWGGNDIHFKDVAEGKQILNDIDSILEGPVIYREIKKLWAQAEPLREEREKIDYDINRLEASVDGGIPLKGWCAVGIAANYEHSQE